jgi:AraC-like DNA-binding protein
MIATGRASLSEIALDSRFSSQSSFTRAFRRATGMTPAEYDEVCDSSSAEGQRNHHRPCGPVLDSSVAGSD